MTRTISSSSLGWARNSDCTCTPAGSPAKKSREAVEGDVRRAGGGDGVQQPRRQAGEELAAALGAGGGDAAVVPGADRRRDRARVGEAHPAQGLQASADRPRRR